MSKDLTDALRAMMEGNRPDKPVPMPSRGSAGAVKSAAALAKTGKDASGGVASPLTETDYADRTFHPEYEIYSSDGLFSLKIKPVASMTFLDANSETVVLNFKPKP